MDGRLGTIEGDTSMPSDGVRLPASAYVFVVVVGLLVGWTVAISLASVGGFGADGALLVR